MGLTVNNALVAIAIGAGAPVNQANGGTIASAPGATVTFSLQSTALVQRWEISIVCDDPNLSGQTLTWNAGQANQLQMPTPAAPYVLTYQSLVSDGASSTAFVSGKVTSNSTFGNIVGSAQIDPNAHADELPGVFVLCPANSVGTPVATLPGNSVAFDETVSWTVHLQMKKQTGGPFRYITRMIVVSNASPGTITTPAGGTVDWDLTPNVQGSSDPALTTVTAAIVPVLNATLQVQVSNPLSFAVWARVAESSVTRSLLPGTGPTQVCLARSVASGPGAGGTVTRLTLSLPAIGITAVTIAGSTASNLTAVVGQPNQLDVTTGPFFGNPGTPGMIIVSNANGPGTDSSGGFTYTTSLGDTFTFLGGAAANVHSFKMANVTQSSGNVTGWTDENGSSPVTVALVGTPTYNASSANWTPAQPSVSLDGSSMGFKVAAAPIASGQGIFAWMVIRWTGTVVASSTAMTYGSVEGACFGIDNTQDSASVVFLNLNSTRGLSGDNTNIHNAIEGVWVLMQDSSIGSGAVSKLALNNTVLLTQTGTGTPNPANAPFTIGFNNATTPANFSKIEIVEWGFMPLPSSTPPSATALSNVRAFWQRTYGTP